MKDEKRKIYEREWWKNNVAKRIGYSKTIASKEAKKRYKRKVKYGLSDFDFREMVNRQNGKCDICKRDRKLVIDHNHQSGKVRELICSRCNTVLGLLYDDSKYAERIMLYLCKHS